jgi:single-strand DNA-binding protein
LCRVRAARRDVAESLGKGTAVLVSGRAAQRTWETQEGEKRRTVEVVADEVAPSLRWATCKVAKATRSGSGFGGQGDGQGKPSGQSQGGRAEADPWASDGGGYSDEPPF